MQSRGTHSHPATVTEGLEFASVSGEPGIRPEVTAANDWKNHRYYAYFSVFASRLCGEASPPDIVVHINRPSPVVTQLEANADPIGMLIAPSYLFQRRILCW